MDPLVSVIMPVYNGEKYVRVAMESILTQTLHNLELIIIDDCSTDNTSEILRSFSDPRLILIKNDSNLKIAQSLNRGIEMAKGKYIARMDADDIAFPARLQVQYEYLEKNPYVGMVGTGTQLFGTVYRKKMRPLTPEENTLRLFFQTCCAHPTIMFLRDSINRINLRYCNDYVGAEDYKFIYEFNKSYNISNIQNILLKYRTFTAETSLQKYKDKKYKLGKKIRKCILEYSDINFDMEELELHCIFSQRKNIKRMSQLDSILSWTEKLYDILSLKFDQKRLLNEFQFQWLGFLKANITFQSGYWVLCHGLHPFIKPNINILKNHGISRIL